MRLGGFQSVMRVLIAWTESWCVDIHECCIGRPFTVFVFI